MTDCLYEKFEAKIVAMLQPGEKLSPLELLALIQMLFADRSPQRCPLCKGSVSVDQKTGQTMIVGKQPCIYMSKTKK